MEGAVRSPLRVRQGLKGDYKQVTATRFEVSGAKRLMALREKHQNRCCLDHFSTTDPTRSHILTQVLSAAC